jgi:hypothetical protein
MSTDRHLPPLTGLQNGRNSGLKGAVVGGVAGHVRRPPCRNRGGRRLHRGNHDAKEKEKELAVAASQRSVVAPS